MRKPWSVEMLLLFLLALLWGSSYLFIKLAVTEIPPMTLIAVRVSIAAGFLLSIMVWQGLALPRDRRTWRKLFVQSVLNSTGAWTILAWGQQTVDSGTAAVLNSTAPIFVLLMRAFINPREKSSMLKKTGVCLGLAGVMLIVGAEAASGLGQQLGGQLAVLLSAVLYAGAAIYGRNFSSLSATTTAAGTMICAALCLIPLSLLADKPWTLSVSWQAASAACLLGVLCTGVALMIYFRLLKTLGSVGVASQSYLRAGVGVVLGAALLGEQVTPVIALGVVIAISGVALINLPVRAKP